MPALETIIGLEIHAQMSTRTKLFCGCSNDAFGKPPNTLICPICTGHPGTLPVPNAAAVEKALRTSLALKCAINASNRFSRKNYFYPDLPAGYQISQYDVPLAEKGDVSYETQDGSIATCRITRLHMENDAGKLMHRGSASLCDFNRAGTPLMEIVTEPDLRSPADAVAFAQELRRILIAMDASEADMFKGMMRFDASISLRPEGEDRLYPRTEIKNLNSFKSLEKALAHEERKLRKRWASEGPPTGEVTVGWLDDEEKTVLLRDKESAADYRYFPEPDIPPLLIAQEHIASLTKELPPLPGDTRKRYMDLGVAAPEAKLLVDQPALQRLFDAMLEKTKDVKRASSLVFSQLLGFLNAEGKTLDEAPEPEALAALVDAVDEGTISGNAAKEVLEEMVKTGKDARTIIEEKGMRQISDESALEALVQQAIEANPQAIASYKDGKEAALGAVVGWIMKQTKGQANPAKVSELLKKAVG